MLVRTNLSQVRSCCRSARRHHRRPRGLGRLQRLNQWERKALELSEERSKLSAH